MLADLLLKTKEHKNLNKREISYEDLKNLPKGTFAEKIIRDKTFNIAKKYEIW